MIGFLAVSNWKIAANRRAQEAQINELKIQIQVLEERKEALKAGLDASLQNDFQEEKIREQGYKKPGEEVIAVLQDGAAGSAQSDQAASDGLWTTIWKKIKEIKP